MSTVPEAAVLSPERKHAGVSKLRLKCPHCSAPLRIRHSQLVSATYREGIAECQSASCGWRGKITMCITETLTPSATPNPSISLPLSPIVEKRLRDALAQDESRRLTVRR